MLAVEDKILQVPVPVPDAMLLPLLWTIPLRCKPKEIPLQVIFGNGVLSQNGKVTNNCFVETQCSFCYRFCQMMNFLAYKIMFMSTFCLWYHCVRDGPFLI